MAEDPPDNHFAQERARAHAQRWATPGNDPFEQWFWKLFRYFNRKVDPEIQEVYRKMLGSIPIAELDAVFEEHIMHPDTPARDPPKVNQLYAMWKARKNKQTGARAKRDASKQVDLVDEPEDLLRKQMFPLVANSLIGSNKLWKYTGDAPEWMRTIARWAGDQYRADHPGISVHELSHDQRQTYFDMALKLFDEERGNHDETLPDGATAPGPDPVRES